MKDWRIKMKVKLACWIKSVSGKLDDLVFCVDKKTETVWVRDYVVPELTEQNHLMGSIAKNLGLFRRDTSEGYFADLKDYSDRYNLSSLGQSGRMNCYAAHLKMMFALKKSTPEVDLLSITPQDVIDNDLPVKTIAEAVENKLLPSVTRFEELTNLII